MKVPILATRAAKRENEEMHRTEYYQSMETKFRQAAESESDPIARERFFTHAEAWELLARASRFISETQADTNEILAAIAAK